MLTDELKPCPFCGGSVTLEHTHNSTDEIFGKRRWFGVKCRNTMNRGGTCAIEQIPSASPEAAIERWNRRAIEAEGRAESSSPLAIMECLTDRPVSAGKAIPGKCVRAEAQEPPAPCPACADHEGATVLNRAAISNLKAQVAEQAAEIERLNSLALEFAQSGVAKREVIVKQAALISKLADSFKKIKQTATSSITVRGYDAYHRENLQEANDRLADLLSYRSKEKQDAPINPT